MSDGFGTDQRTAYVGATVVDGRGGPPLPDAAVLVTGSTIDAVGTRSTLATEGYEVVDLTGRYVIPGLIDTHQHLATPPDRDTAAALLRRQVYGGVTLIRIMADDLRHIADLARATLVGELPGPDIAYAALMAGPSFFTDPRTAAVSQGVVPGSVPWMQAVTEDTDIPFAVAMARGTGATAVKLYADLDADLAGAVTDEAHRQGMQVWAHAAVFPATPGDLVDAGVDVLSHALLLAYEGADPMPPTFAAADVAPRPGHPVPGTLFRRMLDQGTILDATASVVATGFGDTSAAHSDAIVRAAFRAGVPISTGTDYENPAASPWPAVHDEMAYLVAHCGMSTADVVQAATLTGARAAGVSDSRGSIEAGKLADFVVLAADPLADIANLATIVSTVKRGRIFERP